MRGQGTFIKSVLVKVAHLDHSQANGLKLQVHFGFEGQDNWIERPYLLGLDH